MSRLSPRQRRRRVRRLRWGPTDPRARMRWFRLAARIANDVVIGKVPLDAFISTVTTPRGER